MNMSTANNEKQRKKSAPKKIFSEKKRAQKRRHREMTHKEKRQIKFPKEDPGFFFKRITSEEAGKDKMIQDLQYSKILHNPNYNRIKTYIAL